MPLLWVDNIPTIDLNRKYKPGFFELSKTVMELSFPHDLRLHLNLKLRKRRLDSLRNPAPRPLAGCSTSQSSFDKSPCSEEGEFQTSEDREYISFSTTSSSKRPPRLDFLAKVTSLALSFSCQDKGQIVNRTWDHIYDPTEEGIEDPIFYTLLRSVDFQWLNLSTFRVSGNLLPDFYLRTTLFVAPLLQNVTMHDFISVSFEPTTPPAPSFVVRHTNLKDLRLTCSTPRSLYSPDLPPSPPTRTAVFTCRTYIRSIGELSPIGVRTLS